MSSSPASNKVASSAGMGHKSREDGSNSQPNDFQGNAEQPTENIGRDDTSFFAKSRSKAAACNSLPGSESETNRCQQELRELGTPVTEADVTEAAEKVPPLRNRKCCPEGVNDEESHNGKGEQEDYDRDEVEGDDTEEEEECIGDSPPQQKKPRSPDSPSSFPTRLMECLNASRTNPNIASVIAWLPSGDGFAISDTRVFEVEVLPLFFKGGKYMSFKRRLNRWGFRLLDPRGNHDEGVAFWNEWFKRDDPGLRKNMVNRLPGTVLGTRAAAGQKNKESQESPSGKDDCRAEEKNCPKETNTSHRADKKSGRTRKPELVMPDSFRRRATRLLVPRISVDPGSLLVPTQQQVQVGGGNTQLSPPPGIQQARNLCPSGEFSSEQHVPAQHQLQPLPRENSLQGQHSMPANPSGNSSISSSFVPNIFAPTDTSILRYPQRSATARNVPALTGAAAPQQSSSIASSRALANHFAQTTGGVNGIRTGSSNMLLPATQLAPQQVLAAPSTLSQGVVIVPLTTVTPVVPITVLRPALAQPVVPQAHFLGVSGIFQQHQLAAENAVAARSRLAQAANGNASSLTASTSFGSNGTIDGTLQALSTAGNHPGLPESAPVSTTVPLARDGTHLCTNAVRPPEIVRNSLLSQLAAAAGAASSTDAAANGTPQRGGTGLPEQWGQNQTRASLVPSDPPSSVTVEAVASNGCEDLAAATDVDDRVREMS